MGALSLEFLFSSIDPPSGSEALQRIPRRDGHPNTPSSIRDSEWVNQIRNGDADAFTALYTEYLPSMIGFAYRIVRSASVAEDLAADVFIALWVQRTVWSPQHGARAYLFYAVRTRALNYLRDTGTAERLNRLAAERGESPRFAEQVMVGEEGDDSRGVVAKAAKIIAQMPEVRRRVMELRWQHGMTIQEIASVMTLSRSAVDQHLSRGLKTLKLALPAVLEE